jgi:hypothetical protein
VLWEAAGSDEDPRWHTPAVKVRLRLGYLADGGATAAAKGG